MMKKPKLIELILDRVEQDLEAESRPRRTPFSFRASEIGRCPKEIQFSYNNVRPEKHVTTEMVLREGSIHHTQLQAMLAQVGCLTNVEMGGGKLFKVEHPKTKEIYDIMLTTTTDGIFNKDFVVEIKSISIFGFKWLTKPWLQEKHPAYVAQLQSYMEIFDKPWGCLLFKNKDNGGLKEFWYKRDFSYLQPYLTKLVQIATIKDGKKVARPKGYTKSGYPCKGCFYRRPCWGVAPEGRRW